MRQFHNFSQFRGVEDGDSKGSGGVSPPSPPLCMYDDTVTKFISIRVRHPFIDDSGGFEN